MTSEGKISKIRKRDGKIVDFDQEKITKAIWAAAQAVGGRDRSLAERLSDQVVAILEHRFPAKTPTVEDVQDIVEKVLIEDGHARTAKAYILYRKQHETLRKIKTTFLGVERLVSDYLSQVDWRVRENSNIGYSMSGLLMHVAGSVVTDYTLDRIYPMEVADAHRNGDIHLHDLYFGITGYCAGWSLSKLLYEGFNGVPGIVESKPAKHLDTALLQMVNFIGTLQNEWAGAQAFNSIDTYLAPFVRKDKLDYQEIKQAIQKFVFNLNIASRWGGQCVSEDTEVLTDCGWKRYNEVEKVDKIATFNLKTEKIEWFKPERTTVYDYDGDLICLKNRTQEQLVTPNHKVVRKKFNSDEFELIEAKNLFKFKTPILVPTVSETASEKEIDENLLKLCAWLVSEGTFSESRGRVSLYQSEKNEKNCVEIRGCLNNLDFSWDETKRIHGYAKEPVIRFRLGQASSRKVRERINSKKIPEVIKTLSKKQIKLFIDTYIKGDGHIEEKGRIRISTKNEELRDQIQELCTLCGYGTTTCLRKYNKVWQINIIRNSITDITKIFYVKYKGKVWCPTTKNGTFIARRKGKVFITGNSPFTNLTLDWTVPADLKKQPVVWGGKLLEETYDDYQKEMNLINKAFIEVLTEGDMNGRPFTFPIPTYNLTRDFDWGMENTKLLFEMTAKYGLPYFSNFITSDLNPSDIRSMCCRLRLNLRQLDRNITGGLFGSGDSTGSVGVVTINMPRIAYLSKNKRDFFHRLEYLMGLAKISLETKRQIVEKNMEGGLLPYTKRYLGTLKNHFSTIGPVGMNEACLNLLGKDIASEEGKNFAVETLKFMKARLSDFQEETGHIYNLEAVPAEGVSYRLPRIDKKKYPDIITAGTRVPYYTNSTLLPVDETDDVIEALEHQEELQTLYTGGTVFHVLLGERMTSGEAVMRLLKKLTYNTRLPYFTITPTYSICPDHGYLAGEHSRCPICGKETEVYSRVVGYFRPVRNWNEGKQEEFRQRVEYKEKIALEKELAIGTPKIA